MPDRPKTRIARRVAEQMIKDALTDDWIGAVSLATQLGIEWRIVGRALQRMALRGEVEGKEIWRPATRYRKRRSHIYRRKQQSVRAPAWLELPVMLAGGGTAIRVLGVGMLGRSVRKGG